MIISFDKRESNDLLIPNNLCNSYLDKNFDKWNVPKIEIGFFNKSLIIVTLAKVVATGTTFKTEEFVLIYRRM